MVVFMNVNMLWPCVSRKTRLKQTGTWQKLCTSSVHQGLFEYIFPVPLETHASGFIYGARVSSAVRIQYCVLGANSVRAWSPTPCCCLSLFTLSTATIWTWNHFSGTPPGDPVSTHTWKTFPPAEYKIVLRCHQDCERHINLFFKTYQMSICVETYRANVGTQLAE